MMITHKLALFCARTLRKYCDKNFYVDEETCCPHCIFGRKTRPPTVMSSSVCGLEAYVAGRYGKDHQAVITKQVEARMQELKSDDYDA